MSNPTQAVTKPKRKIIKNEPHFLVRFFVTMVLLAILFGVSTAVSIYTKDVNTPPPQNFEECAQNKKNKIKESYPPVCVAKNGQEFIKELNSDENPLPTIASQKMNKVCGGIAGLVCPEGYICILEGNYPDAAGNCEPN